ncbi:mechanosensitive ion channel family protein [Verrucomicrobiota bacterium]
MQWIAELTRVIQHSVGLEPATQVKLFQTLLLVAVLFVLLKMARRIVSWRIEDETGRYLARKTSGYVIGFIGLLIGWRIWLGGEDMALYLGFITAGLAVALKDLLVNLVGWLFIVVRQPFTVGDRIAVDETAGDVIDVRLFSFSLVEIGNWVDADQSTGRIVHVPNGLLFQQAMFNYTQGFNFIWNEVPVTFTFESNWESAKELLHEIATRHSAIKSEFAAREVRKAAKKFLIHFQHLTPIVWTDVMDNGVRLTIRYLCEPRKRRSSETAIWEDLLKEMQQREDIDFAYPTQRFYDNLKEGKPQTRFGRPE